jgi:hypothetical protein
MTKQVGHMMSKFISPTIIWLMGKSMPSYNKITDISAKVVEKMRKVYTSSFRNLQPRYALSSIMIISIIATQKSYAQSVVTAYNIHLGQDPPTKTVKFP